MTNQATSFADLGTIITDFGNMISQHIVDLNNKFDGLENRFTGLENRFDGLESKFDGLSESQKRLEASVAVIGGDITALRIGQQETNWRLSNVEDELTANHSDIKEIYDSLDKIEKRLAIAL